MKILEVLFRSLSYVLTWTQRCRAAALAAQRIDLQIEEVERCGREQKRLKCREFQSTLSSREIGYLAAGQDISIDVRGNPHFGLNLLRGPHRQRTTRNSAEEDLLNLYLEGRRQIACIESRTRYEIDLLKIEKMMHLNSASLYAA